MASQEAQQWRPKARREGLLVEKAGSELVVYNLERHRVHCLNDTAARLWALCTGRRTVEQISAQLEIALDPASQDAIVRNGIVELERLGLVEAAECAAQAELSRRELVRKIGIGALAVGVALPLISSIVAPTPAYAASCAGLGRSCGTTGTNCCPGLKCSNGQCVSSE